MPDQYVLSALQRLELAKRHRPPLFAEVDLISSHAPWTRIPRLIPWDDVGDGSIFHRVPSGGVHAGRALRRLQAGPRRLRPLDRVHDEHDRLVRAALRRRQDRGRPPGRPSARDDRHRPGRQPRRARSRSSPTTRRCMDQIAGWGWQDGLRPSPQAPVWPMSAFRDRFLTRVRLVAGERLTRCRRPARTRSTRPRGSRARRSCSGPARRAPRWWAGRCGRRRRPRRAPAGTGGAATLRSATS